MLFQVPDNTAESVRVALTDTVKKLPVNPSGFTGGSIP
jgi:hypothetical protein